MVISLDGGLTNTQTDSGNSFAGALMVAKAHLFFERFRHSLVQVNALEPLVEISFTAVALEFVSSH